MVVQKCDRILKVKDVFGSSYENSSSNSDSDDSSDESSSSDSDSDEIYHKAAINFNVEFSETITGDQAYTSTASTSRNGESEEKIGGFKIGDHVMIIKKPFKGYYAVITDHSYDDELEINYYEKRPTFTCNLVTETHYILFK